MTTVTREQVLERLTRFGVPLENFSLIADDNDALGTIVFWHPEIGMRSLIIEKDDEAVACYDFLREIGARRFKSWDELREAEKREKWKGWDTCEDYRRMQQAAEELAKKSRKTERPQVTVRPPLSSAQ